MSDEDTTQSERYTDIEKYRGYYNGDLDKHYTGFKDRFSNKASTDTDIIAKEAVPVQNEMRVVIQKRNALVPLDPINITVMKDGEEDEKLTEEAQTWANNDNFESGVTLNEAVSTYYERGVVDGEAPVLMRLKDNTPKVRMIDDLGFEINTDPENIDNISAYVKSYHSNSYVTDEDKDATSTVNVIRTITEKDVVTTVGGGASKTVPHNFGFIPVVLFKREEILGDPHGRPLPTDLLEAQDNLTRVNLEIARANKYGPWGLYCREEGGGSGGSLADGNVTFQPGTLCDFPIKKVSGNGADDSLYKEKDQYEIHLYSLAGLKKTTQDNVGQTVNTSGKALVILNAEGRAQVAKERTRLARFVARIVENSLIMTKKIGIDDRDKIRVIVEFPSMEQDDPAHTLEVAKMLDLMGHSKEALRQMGFEDEKIDSLYEEQDEAGGPLLDEMRDANAKQQEEDEGE